MPTKSFADLGVADLYAAAIAAADITEPFPIQELTLPLALSGADIIGQARTGTGKTLAFGLPLLQRIGDGRGVRGLVVVPTRELCLQVTDDLRRAGARTGVGVLPIYGGVPLEPQEKALRAGRVDVAVGTPGRLLDHLRRRNLDLSHVEVLVLDEADEMLDLGFLPDVERIISECPAERQTMLFSATVPKEVVGLARKYMTHPTFIRAEVEERRIPPQTDQHFFLVHRLDKPRALARILQSPLRGRVLVFVRTKAMADRLVGELADLDIRAVAVHGDLRQSSRERNLDRFRDGEIDVLVATEVAARGLDIEGVTHVINYDCPEDETRYLHRVGRTGRAGAAGVAISFATFNEVDRLNMIRKALGMSGTPLREVFSTSDLLTELFDLPEKTSRTRPAAKRQPGAKEEKTVSDRSPTRPRPRQRARREGAEGTANQPPSAEAPSDAGPEAPTPRKRSRARTPRGKGATAGRAPAERAADTPPEAEPRKERPRAEGTRPRRSTGGGTGGQRDATARGAGDRRDATAGGAGDRRDATAGGAGDTSADRGEGKPTRTRSVRVEHIP